MAETIITAGPMAGRESAATERALERIRQGATPYAAAKAEGLALSTIYRALDKPRHADLKRALEDRRAKSSAQSSD